MTYLLSLLICLISIRRLSLIEPCFQGFRLGYAFLAGSLITTLPKATWPVTTSAVIVCSASLGIFQLHTPANMRNLLISVWQVIDRPASIPSPASILQPAL